MDTHPAISQAQRARRCLLWSAAAYCATWLFYASPAFLAAMLWRVAFSGEPAPAWIAHVPTLQGDAYLVADDGADGYRTLYDAWGRELCAPSGGQDGSGDGRCAYGMQGRLYSTPVWSRDWFD